MGILRPMFFIVGLLLLGLGAMLKLHPSRPPEAATEDPEHLEPLAESTASTDATFTDEPESSRPAGQGANDGFGVIDLPDLGFNLEKMAVPHKKALPPVELVESIFRAYDIRGIVGETLDADVARQVGQCVGSIAVDKDAGPVVVARDGRESGSDLVAGMIEGIASTGCDVIDIGAVPTGVLYFAAYELGSGTGVMVTGSHNPPDYNGFKILIGGVTWAGEQITDMFTRIQSGNLRVGKGKISEQDMLDSYRERISGDIQLKKPLKVVADCGNGIGGICAVDVLRDIGADVMALFDEVDGTFPNHHPDPSEPENLQDLIEAVRLMDADIGVAFDGDADRLGVVTSTGEIIYSDRLMMLFVEDILSRVPGSTIIYDVKCTGHLHYVIEEAGGKPMMYKTGHSLIKNKMKEVNAPFAGEMSGHFFFKERWYGFDCGIYSAARLLEILAADERDAREVLNSLPNSVSTPELKVQMEEGENHAFVAELQQKARFADARITTIDGLRADFVDGWGLVRASNTTPILVCRFDAEDETALQRIKEVFKVQMLAINDQLELPF
ncbi:MAG: phosphomannomutase/phosphoglucomutase [Xanthomonadales bacterium]|nr:phosphomannomutase/phosphoglucomutase [Xanthomonadales bacterium]